MTYVERKIRLRNTTNKRRHHSYEFQTFSTAAEWGGKTGWRLGMFEVTKIAKWRSDEASSVLDADRKWSAAFADHASCLHDQIRGRVTVASEKDIADCRACRHLTGKESRCKESAGRWTGIFCSVELARRSMVWLLWYILVWILAADCLRSGIF